MGYVADPPAVATAGATVPDTRRSRRLSQGLSSTSAPTIPSRDPAARAAQACEETGPYSSDGAGSQDSYCRVLESGNDGSGHGGPGNSFRFRAGARQPWMFCEALFPAIPGHLARLLVGRHRLMQDAAFTELNNCLCQVGAHQPRCCCTHGIKAGARWAFASSGACEPSSATIAYGPV